jgi:hypothetical protein
MGFEYFEYFDMATYQKNGFLSERDYNVLSRKLIKAINPVRVNNIRKGLAFAPMIYSEYSKEELNESLEDDGFSIPLELNNVSIPLIVSFNSSYFPDFELEYTNPYNIVELADDLVFIKEVRGNALKQVPNNNFHSLAIAAYNLEKSIKDSFKESSLRKISEDIAILIEFFIPVQISHNFDITIKLVFTFFM